MRTVSCMAIATAFTPRLPSPLVPLDDERLSSVRLLLKRDDLIGADLAGNKWRKLKYLLDGARQRRATMLLTFGGAYSNHVRALAAAGQHFGFQTIGVIRGDERPYNTSLARAVEFGMQLHYMDRATYRRKRDPAVLEDLRGRFGQFYLVPEGGTTPLALNGCAELVAEIAEPFNLICCPVGTGGTLGGLAAGLHCHQRARGYAVLRGAQGGLEADVNDLHVAGLGRRLDNWDIDHGWHCGGFARRNDVLDEFIEDFRRRHGIDLDAIYVAKMMLGIFSSVVGGDIVEGSTVVAVITGAPFPGDLST